MSTITMHRTGSFNVNPLATDENQCGFKRGSRTCWYDVSIRAIPVLDEHGFLIDNNSVQHYFDSTYAEIVRFDSCESLAMRAVSDLRDIVGHDRCLSIRVEIRPGEYAGVAAESEFLCQI